MSDPLPPDLSRVDPAHAWRAWEPTKGDPFAARAAAHLLRRAAFGAGPERVAQAVRDGVAPTISRLLEGDPGRAKTDALLADVGRRFAAAGSLDKLRGWWLYAMLKGGHPLRERMTLFWHNHFVSSAAKVTAVPLMFRQNQLLREHALGSFGPFLTAVGRDPAILLYLDSNRNVKGRPNENYARELMELFSLGVGNYTEKDVQEAARAFTGWHPDAEGGAFAFNRDEHDAGPKTVLGRSGAWDGDAIVPILLGQKACASFVVAKLYREFVSETPPPAALLEPLAERFRASEYKIADVVATVLRSRLFFSPHAFLKRVKSPVEFILGSVQAAWNGSAAPAAMVPALKKMGQTLFAPPNVKGWRGGRAWLNTATLLARNNFAEQVAMGQSSFPDERGEIGDFDAELRALPPEPPGASATPKEPPEPTAGFDVAGRCRIDPSKPGDAADGLFAALLPGCVSDAVRKQIVAFLNEGGPPKPRIREAAHAVMCSPEYQLC